MTSRRAVLQSLAALPFAASCTTSRIVGTRRNYTPSGLPLRRVNVSPERVVRVVAGLRPYRPGGYVLQADKLDDRLLVHNYGHGGGGITLSWGTSQLALEIAMQSEHRRCAVIGCGAVGLASARLLQRNGWDVTIYARDLPPNTTSNIAGAQWSPASLFDDDVVSNAFLDELGVALRHSYLEFQNLVGPHYGVSWVSNYFLGDRPARDEDMRLRYPGLFPELRTLSPDEHPFPAPHALHFDTMFIEPPVYLPALTRDFYQAGGRIVVREFHDTNELLTLDEPVLINCTGLGSHALFGDTGMMPVKGQLVVLKPEEDINYLMIYQGRYMFPRRDGIMLGGTFEKNDWSLEPDPVATQNILARHAEIFAGMDDPWALPFG